MIRPGFLSEDERKELSALARDGRSEGRVVRRANAMVLLNDGWSCAAVAAALLIDDDTVRGWHKLYKEHALAGLVVFNFSGSDSRLTCEQEAGLVKWIGVSLPRNTGMTGAWIIATHGIEYSHAGLIALLHRLGVEYRKPQVIPRKLDIDRQRAFIAAYENLLNNLPDDEAVMFGDAVHPTHAARPAGCWAPKDTKVALEQTSGRQRVNIHGAIDLETGQTHMLEAATVDAVSTIELLEAIEALYPTLALIHLFLDNARYHHARLVGDWLARPECRIKLHFIPPYCPHLNPIERLWGLMHQHVTHNHCYATFTEFKDVALGFLREKVPKTWASFRDSVTDNFRVINPKDFRVLT